MKRMTAVIGMIVIGIGAFVGLSKMSNLADQPKGFDPDTVPDVVEYTAGITKDTIVAYAGEQPIYAEDFMYWVGYTTEMAGYSAQSQGQELDWTGDYDGMTLADVVKEQALQSAKLYAVVKAKAAEYDCGLDAGSQAEFDTAYQALIEQLGGEAALKKQLLMMGTTESGFLRINQAPYLYNNLQLALVDNSPASAEEMAGYIEANDMLRAKHILLLTQDADTGAELSDDEKALKKEKAEQLAQELAESEDPLTLFDELMYANSEDTGLVMYPNGYDFTAGEMVAEFENATRGLEYNEISGVVESDYGYHIILRLDPADDELAAKIAAERIQTEMDALLAQWMEETQVETTQVYDNIDVKAYYENLLSLREEIELADAAAEAAAATPTPTAAE